LKRNEKLEIKNAKCKMQNACFGRLSIKAKVENPDRSVRVLLEDFNFLEVCLLGSKIAIPCS